MPAVLLLAVVFAGSEPADVLDREGLRLPAAVHVVATGVYGGEPTDSLKVEESDAWISGVQSQLEGDLGFVPRDSTYSSQSATVVFDIKSRRGIRDRRQAETGSTRLDGLVTPLAWVRLAEFARSHNGTVTVDERGNDLVHRVQAPISGFNTFTCYIDHSTRRLRRVEVDSGARTIAYSYDDWREPCPGTQLPWRITMQVGESRGQGGFSKEYALEEAVCRSDAGAPPEPHFSADAVVDDRIAGKLIHGDGTPAEVLPAGTKPQPKSAHMPDTDVALIGAGIVLLGGAAFWYRRKTAR